MRYTLILLALFMVLSGCTHSDEIITEQPTPIATIEPTPTPQNPFHIEGVSVDDVILYFNEVCLDAEFANGGNPNNVQKWDEPIYYRMHGSYDNIDVAVIETFARYLNCVEGFPGMYAAEDNDEPNLNIHFTDEEGMVNLLGVDFYGNDGGVTFWYEEDRIYDETICVLTSLDRELRNSVLLEELYNGLGPVQDTDLREDSIIYSAFARTQDLSDVDRLLIELLYHPEIRCGMNAAECETVIRNLYN